MSKICILGSLNLDIVLKVENMPKVGETIFAKSLTTMPGGKGANQAVASKRMGSEVYMIGKVGLDSNGDYLASKLAQDGINTDFVFKDNKEPTGTAIINVNSRGNNSIVVVAGANMNINKAEIVQSYSIIEKCDVIVAQFETPSEITMEAFTYAKSKGIITILNPAPAKEVNKNLLEYTDIIIPNETEACELTGILVVDLESAKKAAEDFIKGGVNYVIITLGSKGAALITKEKSELIPAFVVNAIDTTAAGDSFIGALASKLGFEELNYENLKKAIVYGNKVSSIVVQRPGAQPSIPMKQEVIALYGED
ncbi:ribokinase [Clostridium bowmanii]|uniref:ribokinase n=1 Tax=Clostridium bowmanii TaxID=132925 RepID=UPI001C0C6DE5|nr:ribokinase [Clostridium bowmanii]MBU3190373.1 ribokinase [Clostridium bowmanii]MCA1074885.1 ribokinase [Clostridium bowmanii]